MRIDRFDPRTQLSQNKASDVVYIFIDQVTQHKSGLAEEMRRVRDARPEWLAVGAQAAQGGWGHVRSSSDVFTPQRRP